MSQKLLTTITSAATPFMSGVKSTTEPFTVCGIKVIVRTISERAYAGRKREDTSSLCPIQRRQDPFMGFPSQRRLYPQLLQHARVIRKWVEPEIKHRNQQKAKEYKRAEYPGQKFQIDVKFVPNCCSADGKKYYQYTAIDECTRWTYRYMYDEHSTYSSVDFLKRLIQIFPAPIREIQTDNGLEFTKALLTNDPDDLSLFESALKECGIIYHRIRVATPRHNGKVERQHREDQKRFYNKMKMYGLQDGIKQIERYNRLSNDIPKVCLGFRTPNEVLNDYLAVMA